MNIVLIPSPSPYTNGPTRFFTVLDIFGSYICSDFVPHQSWPDLATFPAISSTAYTAQHCSCRALIVSFATFTFQSVSRALDQTLTQFPRLCAPLLASLAPLVTEIGDKNIHTYLKSSLVMKKGY